MRLTLLIISISVVFEFVESIPTATITPPEDFVAALDGSVEVFTCTVTNTSVLQWFVDNTAAGSNDILNRGVTATSALQQGSGAFVSLLSIPATQQNDGTTLQCTAFNLDGGANVNSKFIFFQVQGLLGAPPNTVLSEVNDQFVRILSWDAPFTLNITDVEPDILYYQICYNITVDDLVCMNVSSSDPREFTFLNLRESLVFTVTAFNVLGQGNASEIVHEPTRCDNPRGVMNTTVDSLVLLTPSGQSSEVTLLFNQTNNVGPRETCFCIYQVQTVLLGSSAAATDHGPQIPKLSQINSNNLQLSLTVEGLARDEVYVASITTQNDDGEEVVVGTVKFNTYDVQSVSGRALSGGLELSCTFAEGSQAQSCILTVCRIENAVEDSCMNATISRDDGQSGIQLLGLQRGLYVLRKVGEVERDGQVTVHGRIDALEFTIEQAPTIVSTNIAEPPSVGGVSGPSSSDIGAIVGGVLGGICIIIIVVIVIIVAVLLLKNTKKTEKKNPIANLLSESEIDGTKRYSDSQIVEPTYDSLVPLSSREEIPASGHPRNHTHDTETSNKDLWSQDVNSKDSPTFPLYSDVMGKGYPPSVEEVDGSPEVPQMQLTADDLKELNVPTDAVVPTDGQQNPNTEEIQKADLSAESGRETTSEPTASQQRADDELQIVIETLLSLNPEKAQPSAESEDQDQKGPIYAELDHKKKEQSKNYVPDMTGVHYSEIKTDEIAPRLPQKKSKLAAKDLSTSDSPPKSAAHSAPNSDTYDV